jgi:hypothetical protein
MVSLYTYIRKIIGSNLNLPVGYIERFLMFNLVCVAECWAIYFHTRTCFFFSPDEVIGFFFN